MSTEPTAVVDRPLPEDVAERIRRGAFLLVDKPRGPSSHQVTAWARDLLRVPLAGHAGTLDPHVSGVLWVGVGPSLKLIPLMLEFPKRYTSIVTLHAPVRDEDLRRVIGEFVGPIFQTPPVRSAVKRRRRVRTIHRLELLEREGPDLLLDSVVDSGTYLRSLAVDLGDALGVGGHLAELRRTGTGPFTEADAVPLQRVADAVAAADAGSSEPLLQLLHPMVKVWREFPRVVLKRSAAAAVAHGADLARGGIRSVEGTFTTGAPVVLVDERGELVALGQALRDSDHLAGPGWAIDATRVVADAQQYPPSWRARAPTAGVPEATK
ncbi:MAG TPA: RNA-guided pseudouridylation complex pseudouridine synthase subunit Cbf5 [Thermoplasmata archaeon]|nr:RNA-guided pseudouridylation complex pseudouridine synthase subunit Cbf5 [Thermoplasmata archaeon]